MTGQPPKRWSIVSISSRHSGYCGSILHPLLNRVPLTERALWHICHRKISILGIISMFQIYLYCHVSLSYGRVPCASHVADLVLNDLELFNPQQKESLIFVRGIGIPITFWMTGWLVRNWSSFCKFHGPFWINSLTLVFRSKLASSCKVIISIKQQVSIQLSYKKGNFSATTHFPYHPFSY